MKNIDNVLNKLSKSKFRNGFRLTDKDKDYIKNKGMEKIKGHAYDYINQRLAPAYIKNDGKQTPVKGHPVFIAQPATATCCRSCLYKWHHISKGRCLAKKEIDYVVSLIIEWINIHK